jgi:acetylornithine deacetylase/succinyl-diaminopimelate desuccinylase-like protein
VPITDSALQRRLLADLQQFAVPRHARWDPLGLMGVRDALREQLGALGPLEEHRFGSGSDGGTNLILRLPGREPQRRTLLVGAHYDGPLHSPGADDNASGLVALLELARRWAADPSRRPVWLVAFDQEEWGMVGSAALATELKQAGQRLKLMVSLEMLAYTSSEQNYPHPAMRGVYGERGDFIALVANIARTRQIDRRRYLSALLSARGAWVEYLNAVHCALLFMGHESRKGVAFQRIFVDGCAGP